jgi:hypothetical protein
MGIASSGIGVLVHRQQNCYLIFVLFCALKFIYGRGSMGSLPQF